MKCSKCGAEWTSGISEKITHCPFCGEPLEGTMPHRQAVDAINMIVDRFGIGIYFETRRLYALMMDILPNEEKEKDVLKSAIDLEVPSIIAKVITDSKDREGSLKQAYLILRSGGLSPEWCASSLYIFSTALGINSTDLYPLNEQKKSPEQSFITSGASYDPKIAEEYSMKTTDDLLILSENGDVVACTELADRYLNGIEVNEDPILAENYLTFAADKGYPLAEFNLGYLYDQGVIKSHNPELAFEYYNKAAQKDFLPAQYALGQLYYFGEGCNKNDQEAVYWLEKCAKELDESEVYELLAMVYKESEDDFVHNESKAFSYAKKSADMGNENAFNLLGVLYQMGIGVEQNDVIALKYFEMAAQKGVEAAYLNAGACYQAGIGTPKSDKKAAEYFLAGAEAGNMYCLNALGNCYSNGNGVPQDYKKALDLYLKAAHAGNYAGERNLGYMYDNGRGVPQDRAEAKKWFQMAALHGDSEAMFVLGYFFEQGIPDGKPDLEKAFEWRLKAAEVGDNPLAALVVGNCYTYGLLGVKTDRCTGFEWYLDAAQMGQPTAQNNVAIEYVKGEIVDLNYQEAKFWFEEAVAQEDVYGLTNYGEILINGKFGFQDAERGFQMVKRAAHLGSPNAMYDTGVCYFEGWGTKRNLDEALTYLSSALNNGIKDSLEYLQRGFKERNGTWVKRGVFSSVPAPKPLPPIPKIPTCNGGCRLTNSNHSCLYNDLIEEYDGYADYCYCGFLRQKVFTKTKCSYYKSGE